MGNRGESPVNVSFVTLFTGMREEEADERFPNAARFLPCLLTKAEPQKINKITKVSSLWK